MNAEDRVARDAALARCHSSPLPFACLDRLGEAFWAALAAEGGEGGPGIGWLEMPEHGRVRFRALAADMMERAGVVTALLHEPRGA